MINSVVFIDVMYISVVCLFIIDLICLRDCLFIVDLLFVFLCVCLLYALFYVHLLIWLVWCFGVCLFCSSVVLLNCYVWFIGW